MPGQKPTKFLKKDGKFAVCPKCGGRMKMWNFKNNKQNWKFFDTRN
jgi:ssDNA-binding Zn-finger/Zn-ribbon topoisomerase 1